MKKHGFDRKRLSKRSANLGDMDFGTRMKRVIACFCVLLTAPGLAACGKGAQIPQPEPSAALQLSLIHIFLFVFMEFCGPVQEEI